MRQGEEHLQYNEEQFNYWLGALPFYDNVKHEGVVING